MKPKLFIDDERFPPDDGSEWFIARNKLQVEDYIANFGFPEFISFDHDLGWDEPTGYDIARYLVGYDMDYDFTMMPLNFEFYVHSQNPVGATNIQKFLDNYLEFKRDENISK